MKLLILSFLFCFSVNSFAEGLHLNILLGAGSVTSEYETLEDVNDAYKNDYDVDEETTPLFWGVALYKEFNKTLIGVNYIARRKRMLGDLKGTNDDLSLELGFSILGLSGVHYFDELLNSYFLRLDIGQAEVSGRTNANDSFWGGVFDPDEDDGAAYQFTDIGTAVSIGFGRSWKLNNSAALDLGFLQTIISAEAGTMQLSTFVISLTTL